MSAEWGIGSSTRQTRTRSAIYYTAIAVIASVLFGAAAAWAVQETSHVGLPSWVILAAPVVVLIVLLIGVLNYNLLVLITFSLIGFVWFEPAPFDLLFVALLGIGLITGRLRWPNPRSRILVQIGLWGLVVANLLSTFGVVTVAYNLRYLGITLYLLALFVFVRMYAIQPGAIRLMLIGITVSAVLNALSVIMGFFGLDFLYPATSYTLRGVGFFKDFNVFGPFVALAAFWILDQTLQPPYRLSRTGLLLLLSTLLVSGAVLSQSRAVWICLFLSGFIYFGFLLLHAPRKGVIFLTIMLAIGLTAFFLIQYFGLVDFVRWHWQIQAYDEVRFSIQRAGFMSGFTRPLGIGPGGLPDAHSLYVRTLAEHGILGLASLGLLIGALVFPLAQRAWIDRDKSGVLSASILLAIIIGQLVNSLVIDSIHWRHLWVILGITWAFLDLQREKEN
jgi:hypothetical protein